MTVTFVQSSSSAGSSTSLGSNTAPGNCIVACVQGYGASSVSKITCGGNLDNWAQLIAVSGGGQVAAVWIDPGCEGGDKAVAFTASGASQQNIQAYEFAGLGTSPSMDVSPATHLQTAVSSTSWSAGPTATADAGDLWLAMFAGNQANVSYSSSIPVAPWNCPEGKTGQTGAGNETTALISGYQIPGAAGTVTFSGNQSSSSGIWAGIALALEPGSVTVTAAGSALLAFPA